MIASPLKGPYPDLMTGIALGEDNKQIVTTNKQTKREIPNPALFVLK